MKVSEVSQDLIGSRVAHIDDLEQEGTITDVVIVKSYKPLSFQKRKPFTMVKVAWDEGVHQYRFIDNAVQNLILI